MCLTLFIRFKLIFYNVTIEQYVESKYFLSGYKFISSIQVHSCVIYKPHQFTFSFFLLFLIFLPNILGKTYILFLLPHILLYVNNFLYIYILDTCRFILLRVL